MRCQCFGNVVNVEISQIVYPRADQDHVPQQILICPRFHVFSLYMCKWISPTLPRVSKSHSPYAHDQVSRALAPSGNPMFIVYSA